MKDLQELQRWASELFGIPKEDVLWYHSGSCYDRIGVKTKESADKVTEKVKGESVNGGMLDGMPLGGQTHHLASGDIKDAYFEIYC